LITTTPTTTRSSRYKRMQITRANNTPLFAPCGF
jgi:hypothetical protein